MKVRATSRLPRPIYRLYKEAKCRECAVVVTKMDFAKILGKFTKVKIQYESNSPKSKTKKSLLSPVSKDNNSRLKNNENGMVLIHRNAYSKHPVKELSSPKRLNNSKYSSRNVLKENNIIKKSPAPKERIVLNNRKQSKPQSKRYGLVFTNPRTRNYDARNKTSLTHLLASIDNSILPSEHWCLEYFPKNEEPEKDAVYDRIAAELEDMYSESNKVDSTKKEQDKDEFPSILDILNENITDAKSDKNETNVSPSDVEAMLAGACDSTKDDVTPMEVDNNEIKNKSKKDSDDTTCTNIANTISNSLEEPPSPSILDESEKVNNEVPVPILKKENNNEIENKPEVVKTPKNKDISKNVTHIVFKLMKDDNCCKSVTCPKNLKYTIEMGGKHVELLGAPKFVSSVEDLKVLLQIVNESELESFYVYH